MRIRRVAVVFDNTARPETTGGYCLRALERLVDVTHFLPSKIASISSSEYDLLLSVDDGLKYPHRPDLQPSAYWAIDTHLDFERSLERAREFDFVFAAQRDGAERLRQAGIGNAAWLPLACDPEIHARQNVLKKYDICFVGNLFPGPRSELLEVIQQRFRRVFVGQRYFDEMARTYSESCIVFNRSLQNDLNMRVFEALASGSLLITNDLSENGQSELFRDGIHLATYKDEEELLEKIAYYVRNEKMRERIAETGREEVLAWHTYEHRMRSLLESIELSFDRKISTSVFTPPPTADHQPIPNERQVDGIMNLIRPCWNREPESLNSNGGTEDKSGTLPDNGIDGCKMPAESVQEATYFDFPRPEVANLVPLTARRILDIGCGTGRLGASLMARQEAEVVGIEIHASAADRAKECLDEVRIGNIESTEIEFAEGRFDCVICADVLEHLREPAKVLERIRRWLTPDGTVVASIPNVRNHSVIQSLLDGNWTYESAGLLDRDHVRFFTRREIQKLFFRAGFQIDNMRFVPGQGYAEWIRQDRPAQVTAGVFRINTSSSEHAEEFFAYQYLVQATVKPQPDLGLTSIILLTFNQLEFTRLCIDSIRLRTDEPYELIVIDNASTDGTVEWLLGQPDIRIVANAENRGFPAAVNQGLRMASGKNLLLLNNDTLVTTGWLRRLLEALHRTPSVGIVGPVSNNVAGYQQVEVNYDRLESLDGWAWDWGQTHAGQTTEVDRLIGFCLLFKRELMECIGNLDERFGVGCYEDDDYCRRARNAGYRTVVANDAFIHHFGSQTFLGSGFDFARILEENRKKYEEKWRDDRVDDSQEFTHDQFGRWESLNGDSAPNSTAELGFACTEAPMARRDERVVSHDISSMASNIERLRYSHPWPDEKPDVEIPAEHIGWMADGVQQSLKRSLSDDTTLVLELGTWLGMSARFILDHAPNASVIAIDHWLGSPEHHSRPEYLPLLPQLFETFQAMCWSQRERIIPLRMTTQEGLHAVAEARLQPDLIFFDAEHSYSAVMADLQLARSLFPAATLLGDDYDDPEVSRAIADFARQRELQVETTGSNWRAWTLVDGSPKPREGVEKQADLDHAVSVLPQALLLERIPDGSLRLKSNAICLSLCMIVRDNETTIGPCLESAKPYFDEIVVVDTGSQDRTPAICRQFGARMFEFPWCDDFSAARNESLRHARGKWIFWMDSDDTLPADCGRRLRELAHEKHPADVLGYVMQVHCPGSDQTGADEVTIVDHVKLIPNRSDICFEGRIHEQVLPAIRRAGGEVLFTDIHVVHSGSDHSPEANRRKLERDFRILKKDIAERPDHPFVLFNLGMTYADAKEYPEAIRCLCRSIEVASPGESHLRKAYALLVASYASDQQFAAAETTCRQALELFPEDRELLFRSAMLHNQAGRLVEAERDYLKLLEDPSERHFSSVDVGLTGYKGRQNLALVYEQAERFAEAETQWRQVIKEQPHYSPGWRGLIDLIFRQQKFAELDELAQTLAESQNQSVACEAMIVKARLAEARGDLRSACQLLTTAIGRFPTESTAHEALCKLLFERGTPLEAETALKDFLKAFPEDASAWHNLGTIAMSQGRKDSAILAYNESLSRRPDSASTYLHLGYALDSSGCRDEAVTAWRKALQFDPNNAHAQQALRSISM